MDEAALLRALTTRTIAAGSELCELQKSDAEAATSRDALAKAAYERLFDALILLVNASLAGASSAANVPATAAARHPPTLRRGSSGGGGGGGGGGDKGGGGFIGLLDIFGNEVFGVNSYEQLLINFANEKLQQHFISTAISHVQAVYEAEMLPFSRIVVVDNGPILSLLEGKPVSLLALLDDLCLHAGASDDDFVSAVHARFEGHAAFAPPRFDAATQFTVRHFAGEVSYRGLGFIAKNKDTLFAELPAVMRTSASPFVRALFADRPTKGGGGGGGGGGDEARGGRRRGGGGGQKAAQNVSVGAQFRVSMSELISTLQGTQSHFIRCIKPNAQRAAFTLTPSIARAQLRCCGVLEAVRVSQAGFPTRMPFAELLDRYALLLPPHVRATVAVSRGGGGGGGGGRGSVVLRRRNSRNDDRDRAPRTPSPAVARKAVELQQAAGELLRHLGFAEDDFMLGRTLAFLRSGALARCEAARTRQLGRVFALLQSRHRARAAVARLARQKGAAVRLQRAWRRRVAVAAARRLLRVKRVERTEQRRREAEERREREALLARDTVARAAADEAERARAEAEAATRRAEQQALY